MAIMKPFCLGLMTFAATVVYSAAKPLGLDRLPFRSIVYYWITGPAGFLLLVVGIIQCARRKPKPRRCVDRGEWLRRYAHTIQQ